MWGQRFSVGAAWVCLYLICSASTASAEETTLEGIIQERIKVWEVHSKDVNFPETAAKLADAFERIGIDSFAFPAEEQTSEDNIKEFLQRTEKARSEVLADVRGEGRKKWDGFIRDLDVIAVRASSGAYGYNGDAFNKLGGHRDLWRDIAAALNGVAQQEQSREAERFEANLKTYTNYMQRSGGSEPRRRRHGCLQILLGL